MAGGAFSSLFRTSPTTSEGPEEVFRHSRHSSTRNAVVVVLGTETHKQCHGIQMWRDS
jgi:hypothetical protein